MNTSKTQQNIPSGWQSTFVDDICYVMKGQGLSKKYVDPSGKNKCILYGELFTTYDEVIEEVKSRTNSIEGVPSMSGDILIPGSTTTVAKDLAVASALNEDDVLLGGDINILRKKNDLYNSNFLAYYLTHYKKDEIGKLGQGTTIVHLYGSNIKDLEVIIPKNIKEQQKIAEILRTVDEDIAKTQEVIKATEKLKRGLMQQFLTGQKQRGKWRSKKLEEIAIISRGGSPRPIESYLTDDNDGLSWLRIGDIDVADKYIYRTTDKIKKEGLKKTTQVNSGDLILSNSMSFGRPYIMKIDACIHDGWLAFKHISKEIRTEYLYYILLSNEIQNTFFSLAMGSGVKNLKRESVSSVEIKFPEIKKQDKILEIFSAADEKILVNKKLKEKLILLRKGLMQDLLSGKVRTIIN